MHHSTDANSEVPEPQIPGEIKVGPYVYTVTLHEALEDDGLRGVSDTDLHYIRLNPKNPPALQRSTLLHECMHAVAASAGIGGGEKLQQEDFITRVEAPLTSLLRDNADLVAYLIA